MVEIQRRATLAAPAAEVFRFVTDPEHFADYVSGYDRGRITSEQKTGAGSAFTWEAHLGPLRIDARELVVAWEPPRRVAYAGEMAGVSFRSRMELRERAGAPEAPAAGGNRGPATELTVGIEFQVPASRGGPAAAALLKPLIARDVQRSLDRLVARFGSPEGLLDRSQVVDLYRRRAGRYDAATQLYRLAGFRLATYRRRAADAMALQRGDTAVEIGCGTGANLGLLRERVGPSGRVIGVDLTDAMLAQAEQRIRAQGWDNVSLVRSDAADYDFPEGVNGILSTLALTLSPDYDAVIARGAGALAPGGRWVILDLKLPEGLPDWALRLGLLLTRPYGVTLAAASRHPWESLERHLPHTQVQDLYLGLAYLAVGWKDAPADPA